MSTGCGMELIVWILVRWKRGYSDQRMELECWCISPMAVVRSPFRYGDDVVGGYCVGVQASEITRDLCFIAQDSFETLRHRFSWRLWRSSAAVFESYYIMKVRNYPCWEEMRMEFQSTIHGLISVRSWCLARLQWCGWVGTFLSSNGAAQLEPSSPPMVQRSWNLPSQWCGCVGTFLSSNGVAKLEPSSPPMVRLSWNLPILQWCGSIGTFLSSNGAAELEPSFSMVRLLILHPSTDRRKPTFPITSLIFSLGAGVDPASQWSGHMRHSLLTLSLFLFLSFLSFSLFLSLSSLASCQNFSFSNGLLLSFFLYVLFFFLLHWCGCSLQSVPPLLPWTQPHTPSMYMLKPFLSTCHNRLWKFIFSFIRKMPISSILAKI